MIPFYVSFDGTHYRKELEEIGIREFYEKMVEKKGVYPKSSLPSVQDYLDVFLPLAKENIPMLVICNSTKLSGSMQSALSARQLVLEDYPDARIRVIDSTYCTVLQGLLALEAASMQERGAGLTRRLTGSRRSGRPEGSFLPWEIWNTCRRADGSAVWPAWPEPFLASGL